MQVRTVEFQEHFGRIPLEGARQHDLIQKSVDQAMLRTATELSGQQELNRSRPMPTDEAENPIVDPRAEGRVPAPDGRTQDRRRHQEKPGPQERAEAGPGRHIDFVV